MSKYKFQLAICTTFCTVLTLYLLLSSGIGTVKILFPIMIYLVLLIFISVGAIIDHITTELKKMESQPSLKEISKNSKVIFQPDTLSKRIYRDVHLTTRTEFVCPICGAVNEKSEFFCVQCGSQIIENISMEDQEPMMPK